MEESGSRRPNHLHFINEIVVLLENFDKTLSLPGKKIFRDLPDFQGSGRKEYVPFGSLE